MSNPESFIEEVTEEVRRDRLFAWMRRYGWIAVLAVLLLVGGASWREWRSAQQQAAAEALGDGILSALDADDAAARVTALEALPATGEARALVTLLAAGESGGDAAPALRAMANDAALPLHYTQLAALKLVMIEGSAADPAARLETLAPLAEPGRPYRPLALEQMALAEIDAGNTEAALGHLRALVEDAGTSAGLRQRASQLIVSLGGGVQEG
ncbi:hypothetical protein [Rhodovulum euryhalinum]|uniref:Tetratricopeptide repeat-like domain-containing protein n=1 Tax=Rhodovulum euryhalinum TaxID=35805 RepID=A0A4R2KK21_9RHOB|nr:hypothetical protein [Rhodovulum euryhalinum]TCO70956.1 hypothetical protein EV655_108198 [Rhodovulum euryhalinum]